MTGQNALAILEAIPDALFRIAGDGTILYYKPSSLNLLDIEDTHKLVGTSIFDLPGLPKMLSESLLDKAVRRAQLAIETGRAQCFEIQLEFGKWPLCLEIRTLKAAENEAVVVIREVSQDRRQRGLLEMELAETRALVGRLYDEQSARQQKLAEALTKLASQADPPLRQALLALGQDRDEPAEIAPEDLGHALRATVDQGCPERMETRLRAELNPEHLTSEVATYVHHVVRGAVACICRYSNAEQVRISVVNNAELLSLLVTDDAAQDARLNMERGLCVAKLRHHTEGLGGSLRVSPGRRGTALRLRLPLKARRPPDDDAR